jgi:acyl-CoA dehydrogenase
MITVLAHTMALRELDRAIDAVAATGLPADFPLAAMYADSRTVRFADGPDEVHCSQILELRDR